jgi:hypothetical protein
MKRSETKLPETAPESFEQLCGILLPRPVHNKAENREMIRVMDWIAVRAHNQDQFDYAKMLGSLVTEYEVYLEDAVADLQLDSTTGSSRDSEVTKSALD